MIHVMSLAPSPFEKIRLGTKTVEMRLYDDKRAKIKIGDVIEFENIETRQKVKCLVTALTRLDDFYELYSIFDKTTIGYDADEVANAEDMYQYYTREMIKAHGVLAIEIKLIQFPTFSNV